MSYDITTKLKLINPEEISTSKKLAFKSPPPAPNKKIKEKDCPKAVFSSSTVFSPSFALNTNIVISCSSTIVNYNQTQLLPESIQKDIENSRFSPDLQQYSISLTPITCHLDEPDSEY